MTKKLNPHEAPKGYVAVLRESGMSFCAKCALHHEEDCGISPCMEHAREDGCDVIFKKAPVKAKGKTVTRWAVQNAETQLIVSPLWALREYAEDSKDILEKENLCGRGDFMRVVRIRIDIPTPKKSRKA